MKLTNIKIHYLIKLLLFWLLFFASFRLLFVLYHHARIPDGEHAETVLAFFYALPLDLSAACMALLVPSILWSFQQYYKCRRIHILNTLFIYTLVIIVSILSIANIKMYGEWGTQLSARAFNYLRYPKEVMHFISVWSLTLLLISCLLISFFSIRGYRTYITNFSYPIENKNQRMFIVILTPLLLLLGYRGGFQQAPINESKSYYSSIPINNHIATNNIWYLVHSFVDANDTKNPYIFMDEQRAKKITSDLYQLEQSTGSSILKVSQPNIVVIVLESWTADLVKALGGEKQVTPNFDKLTKEGLLLTKMYGSGFRTEQGLISILSGFPSQPNNSIITTPSKSEKLPSITMDLVEKGYASSFYYGGEIEFANMKSYLVNTGFKKITDKQSFLKSQLNSKWGAHDEFVFEKQLQDLAFEKTPFFSVVLTLSTHEPFEVPMQTPYTGTTDEEKFKKAAYYTDHCLATYFNAAKKQPWYASTLFVLIADHGHHLPKNRNMDYPEGRKITAMLLGGALADSLQGKTLDKLCNQHDIPASLFAQLKLPSDKFAWSKNIFEPGSKEFAYYSNENCLGWITPNRNYVYSFASKKTETIPNDPSALVADSALIQAQAYLQTLYQTYLDY